MKNKPLTSWLEDLSAKTPTPGGGAVAALLAAISAAQLGMVASYTTGAKWEERDERMRELGRVLNEFRDEALKLMQADADAFKPVGESYQMPRSTDEEKKARTNAIQNALTLAAEPPVEVVTIASQLIEISAELARSGNPSVISDVAVGATTARAALESAIVNIEINKKLIRDADITSKLASVTLIAQEKVIIADEVILSVRKNLS